MSDLIQKLQDVKEKPKKVVKEKPKKKKNCKQHFLLSKSAKTITQQDLYEMSDDTAKDLFMELQWGKKGHQCCPHCATLDKHYYVSTRDKYKCRHCGKQFSLTSNTIFAYHKLSLKKLIQITLRFLVPVKGTSAITVSREFDVQHKTVLVIFHKLREAMKVSCLVDFEKEKNTDAPVHIDGTYVHTNNRKANKKEDRKDARLAENANPDKRCVFVMVKERTEEEKASNPHLKGSKVVLPFIIKSETSNVVKKLVAEYIKKDSVIHADESNAYDDLIMYYDLKRVNHSKEYCSDEGITNNHAESFFSRFKRGFRGQYHRMTNKYLDLYSFEFAFRENKRRLGGLEQLTEVLQYGLQLTRSAMRGYWQGLSTKQAVTHG